VESRLRIVRDRASAISDQRPELVLLARRLGYSGPRAGEELLADYERETQSVRAAFLRVLSRLGCAPPGP